MRAMLAIGVALFGCKGETNNKLLETHKTEIDAARARFAAIATAFPAGVQETCTPGKWKLDLHVNVQYALVDALSGRKPDAIGIGEAVFAETNDIRVFLRDTAPGQSKDFLDDSPEAELRQAIDRVPKLPYVIAIGVVPEAKMIRFALADAQTSRLLCQFEVTATEKLIEAYRHIGTTNEQYGDVVYQETGDAKRETSEDMAHAAKEHLGLDLRMAY